MDHKRIVVVPDLQIPYHDKRFVLNLCSFIRLDSPDMLVNVGDDIDAPEVSRWTKGGAGEYAKTLQASFDETIRVHSQFRFALGWGKEYHISRSNHGDRLRKYITRYAPALSTLRDLNLNRLAGYDTLRMTYHEKPFEIAPGWVCAHGDEGTLSKIPGKTALGLAEKWGTSVVCGHTHRAAIVPASTGFNGKLTSVYGLEVGHGMVVKNAGYMAAGHANWQQAFGILDVYGRNVYPQVVFVRPDGTFVVDGIRYGGKATIRNDVKENA